ncbi:MFS transporter [Paenibacillus sp. Soil724D2]|uniref:MFS transporter n=1 Tax=Paenibacillus sp. (strain Soil724D2) TaxID=1736392 RepID=UPI000714F2BE|nr:MFS transporter [Paenibacillus sp. Soil724D2]KRE51390.1 hypothetical protein ASG85_17825 [Paenibacillus sp. Soil724D2]
MEFIIISQHQATMGSHATKGRFLISLNLGNASGAFIGGWVITHMVLTFLPWAGALLPVLGLILGLVSIDRTCERNGLRLKK